MRLPLRFGLSAFLTSILLFMQPLQDASAKGPKGGGRGGGKSQAGLHSGNTHGGYSKRPTNANSSKTGSVKHSGSGSPSKPSISRGRNSNPDSGSKDGHPWSMQRANEDRKLDHRMSVADKLDRIAEQNGNSQLHETAQRKRQQAQQIYEKRMTKIDGQDRIHRLADEPLAPQEQLARTTDELPAERVRGADPGLDEPPTDADQRSTGQENSLDRQLRNEERQLARRMETADRLWDAYERTGDEQLADLAQAMEERALEQYEKRLQAIGEFQQRHGLPGTTRDRITPVSSPLASPVDEARRVVDRIAPLLQVLP